MTKEAQNLTLPKITNGPLTDRLQHKADTTEDQGTRSLCLEAKARIERAGERKMIKKIVSWFTARDLLLENIREDYKAKLRRRIDNGEIIVHVHKIYLTQKGLDILRQKADRAYYRIQKDNPND